MSNSNNNHKLKKETIIHANNARPTSALLRGVKITEFNENRINPEPVTKEEINFFVGDALSSIRLKSMTGCDDLTQVETLELKVNTNERSLGNFGEHLPNLNFLKLSHSFVPVVRDLGSYLDNLKVLHMCRCGVSDLDGLPMLVSLRELYLAYNNITDISSCGLLEHLTILDVEGNNVSDFSQLSFLGLCSKLTSLTLEGNPICIRPHPDSNETNYNYREAVLNEIKQLKVLDGEIVSKVKSAIPSLTPSKDGHKSIKKTESSDKANVMDLLEDWDMLDNLMGDSNESADENLSSTPFDNIKNRPATQRPPSLQSFVNRPGSSLKGGKLKFKQENDLYVASSLDYKCPIGEEIEYRAELNISANAVITSDYSMSCSELPPETGTSIDSGIFSASSLEFSTMVETSGIVFCGNLARAMRFRKQTPSFKNILLKEDSQPTDLSPVLPKKKTILVSEMEASSVLDVDLEVMKNEIKRSIEQIKTKKAPQVLKIIPDEIDEDSDDAVCLNDDDDDVEDQVTLHRRSEPQKNDIDKKRESLESFADYFIELASDPINPGSKLFRHHSDLDRFYDKESHCIGEDDQSDAMKLNSVRFRGRGLDKHGRDFADSLEIQTPSNTFSLNIPKNKKDAMRLHQLPRINHDSLTSISSSNMSHDHKLSTNRSKKRSTNTIVSNLGDKTVMKAASQFLRTGRVADSNF